MKLLVSPARAARLLLCPERQEPLSQNLRFCQLPFQESQDAKRSFFLTVRKHRKSPPELSSISQCGSLSRSLLRPYNHCLSVIFRFLLSAFHRLSTRVLCLRVAFSKDAAAFYCFNRSLLVCTPLRGTLLFTHSLPDIRRPLKRCFIQ